MGCPWDLPSKRTGTLQTFPGKSPVPIPFLASAGAQTWTAPHSVLQRWRFSWGPKRAPVLGESVGKARSASLFSQKSALEALWGGVTGGPSAVLLSFHYRVCTSHHQCLYPPGVPWALLLDKAGKNFGKKLQHQRVQALLPFTEREAADKERGDWESWDSQGWVPDPFFPPAAAPHLSFHSEGIRSAGWAGSEKKGLMTLSSWVPQPKRQKYLWGWAARSLASIPFLE